MLIEELIELANKNDTLSSFSSQDSGGILVFGIDKDAAFQVVGVYDPQDLQKKITEQCLQMEPPVRAVFTLAEYQGKAICAADLPMTDYELYSYEAFRKYLHEDERPVERATLQLLDTEKIHSLALRQLLCLARKSAM